MDLSINRNLTAHQAALSSVEAASTPKNAGTPSGEPSLTITRATAADEDFDAAGIPEAALSRTDPLGKLVETAFNLPPPPMPDFN